MLIRWALCLALLPGLAAAAPVTATRTLPTGTVLSESDLKVADDQADRAAVLGTMVGLETRVMIYEGKPVSPAQLSAPTLVERNQIVTLAYISQNIRIDAEGRALSSGHAGQTIRVMNLSSRTTISGQVAPDGTVVVQQR